MDIHIILGILGIVTSVALLVWGAYRGIGAFPIVMLAIVPVALLNDMDLYETYTVIWTGGFVSNVTSYLFVLVCSCTFAKLMQNCGAATKIALQFIDWFGTKQVMLLGVIICAVMVWGGVYCTVVVFTVAPILFYLFKEADLPRHLTAGVIALGGLTFAMTLLPGNPQLLQLVACEYLGTTLTAAPVLSIIGSAIILFLGMLYLKHEEKKARLNGEHFSFPESKDPSQWAVRDRADLPKALNAFIPLVFMILTLIIGCQFTTNVTRLVIITMFCACIIVTVLNFKFFKGKDMKKVILEGVNDGIGALTIMSTLIGFGSVLKATDAYQAILNMLFNLKIGGYYKMFISVSAIAAITGSSSVAVRLGLDGLVQTYLANGCTPEILHRLTTMTSGGLDTLPFSSGIFLMLSGLGLSHKEGYKHMFVLSVVLTFFVALFFVVVCSVLGL